MESNKPVISIDIYDTAIFRNVYNPKDIFKIVENKIGDNFSQLRENAQLQAAQKNPNYNIIDIYKILPKKFNFKNEILEEIKNSYANRDILDFYSKNKDVCDFIFISDMYLPSSVLKAVLEHAGYENPRVFVSCEEKCTKGNGQLFLKVQEKIGKKIDKHIGDNYAIDIKGAKLAKIPEVEYIGPSIYKRDVVTPELKNPILRRLCINNELNKKLSSGFQIGYLFAPLIFLFTKEVLNKVPDGNTIFFNARDGFLIYVAARWMLKTKKKIKYCRFSRKSVHLPGLNINYDISDEKNKKAFNFLSTVRTQSLSDFLTLFNINTTVDCSELLKRYSIGMTSNISFHPKRQQILREFVVLIKKDIYKRALIERKNCLQYIKRLGMKNGDLFVDLGHFGSMQSILQDITGLNLQGEYVHLLEGYRTSLPDKYKKNSFVPMNFLRYYTGIAEIIFTELRGTVTGYTEEGKPIVLGDTKYRKDVTKEIFRGVFRGVRDIINNKIDVYYEDCLTILKRLFELPTLKEAQFANNEIFENGSSFANESVVWYNRGMIKAGKIRECYSRSYWKPAFKILLKSDADYKNLIKEV